MITTEVTSGLHSLTRDMQMPMPEDMQMMRAGIAMNRTVRKVRDVALAPAGFVGLVFLVIATGFAWAGGGLINFSSGRGHFR